MTEYHIRLCIKSKLLIVKFPFIFLFSEFQATKKALKKKLIQNCYYFEAYLDLKRFHPVVQPICFQTSSLDSPTSAPNCHPSSRHSHFPIYIPVVRFLGPQFRYSPPLRPRQTSVSMMHFLTFYV